MQLTNRTTHFYCEVILRNEKLELSSNQVQNLLFLERLLPNKTTIRKNVKKYERDGPSFNMNKERSGRTITTRSQKIIDTVRQALERNQGRISAGRNGLGILPSSFCQIIKKNLRWCLYKMIRRHNLK